MKFLIYYRALKCQLKKNVSVQIKFLVDFLLQNLLYV